MKHSGWFAVWLLATLAPLTAALAQNVPDIGFVYPAGGQRGTTVTVAVGGQYLDGVDAAYLSGEGVKAEVVEHIKPMPRRIYNELGQKLRELKLRRDKNEINWAKMDELFIAFAKSKGLEEMDMATYNKLRRKMNDPKRQPNAQLDERVVVRLTIAEDAKLGARELRLKTPKGLTNPLIIHVGQHAEHAEAEPNNGDTVDQLPDALPLTINGQVMPGDVDRFRFKARKGMQLVASVEARSLIPYLADAVPGWFQATLSLKDLNGREIAYCDDHGINPDPLITCRIPADGDYILEIRDAIYRGREDFVYRITLGEVPFVTAVYPMGCQSGKKTAVELTGWNLASSRIMFKTDDKQPGVIPFLAHGNNLESNCVSFALDTFEETKEVEPNNEPRRPQKVKAPLIVNGHIDRTGDIDIYQFTGIKGEHISVEIRARRLGSELDSILKVTDTSGKLLAANDDFVDKGAGLTTHQADSRVLFQLAADGIYLVHVADAQNRGGPTFGYRMRIGAPQPDFALRVVPSSINALAGTNVPLTVYALRQDGFDGPIELKLVNMPTGFSLAGAIIPAGQEKVRMTMAVPPAPLAEPIALQLEGRAQIDGDEIRRAAVAADDQMQAFLYRHLVPMQQGLVMVGGKARRVQPVKVKGPLPVRISVGGKAQLQIVMPKWLTNQLTLQLSDPPEGLTIKKVTPNDTGVAIELIANGEDVKPGLRGNLIIEAHQLRSWKNKDGKKQSRRVKVGVLPAVPFEITPAPLTSRKAVKQN